CGCAPRDTSGADGGGWPCGLLRPVRPRLERDHGPVHPGQPPVGADIHHAAAVGGPGDHQWSGQVIAEAQMRIAIAGISHEALTFSPLPQTLGDFRVWRGAEILEYPGLGEAVRSVDFEPVPILVARGECPSGVVEERAYLQLRDEMLEGIRRAGTLDGLCLVLHGAMLVENIWSSET